MDAQLAGLVTLVSYGNLYLARVADADIESESRDELASIFRFVEQMQFGDGPADSPLMAVGFWFGRLLDARATRLWLTGYAREGGPPPHIAAAFANGIPVGIGVEAPETFTLMVPQSDFVEAQGRWVTRFAAHAFEPGAPATTTDLDAVAGEIEASLREIGAFAAEVADVPHWRDRFFDPARAVLRGGKLKRRFLPARGYGEPAQRLYSAATTAWVFGGMGSWNDMSFSDDGENETYDRLSARLYAAIVESISAAANAFDPAARCDAPRH